jgi:hypothetical protein
MYEAQRAVTNLPDMFPGWVALTPHQREIVVTGYRFAFAAGSASSVSRERVRECVARARRNQFGGVSASFDTLLEDLERLCDAE